VGLSPGSVTLAPGGSQPFLAAVSGATNTAVTWSATCGSIDASGNYTAPGSAPASCTVTATSVADATKSATATITVTSSVSVQVSPSAVTVSMGDSAQLYAQVTGAANRAVVWSVIPATGSGSVDGSGLYTTSGATATPPFSVTVRATSVADGTKMDQATVNVVSSSVYTVSGNVTYGGGAMLGNVYVNVYQGGGNLIGGTMIHGTGPYTIRCLQYGGSYQVLAWADLGGWVTPLYATDPWVKTASFNFTGSADVTGVNVALLDPTPSIPGSAPTGVAAIPGDSFAVIGYNPIKDSSGRDVADHYDVFVSTTPNPGPQNTWITRHVSAAVDSHVAISPLTNGTPYYVAVAAVNSAGTGPAAQFGPFTTGPKTGGNKITGSVDLTGITATGPLYVYVGFDKTNNFFVARISNPSGIVNYEIDGVPDGTASHGVRLDQNDDGIFGQLDPSVDNQTLVVSGNTTVPAIVLSAAPAVAGVYTEHSANPNGGWDGGSSEQYALDLYARPNLKLVTKAVLLSGANTGTNVPVDLGVNTDRQPMSLGVSWYNIGNGVPVAGDLESILVTFADGTQQTLSGLVTGTVAVPTSLQPSGTGVGITPSFSWTAPSPTPSAYTYSISVFWGSTNYWEVNGLASSVTQPVPYNFDGSGTALTLGMPVQWWVYVQDGLGNRSSAGQNITP
jgi:hypothetical protein